ncbi:hypothetical protein SS50377_25553 [Spironucleus salmonicida]|uniref:Uncharacterized protein n=1 Tax=Spironucleus salmonicida TaxID=348837 RepID=V6LN15_9EUKA|nr:hypothetical protein SS50377_25553 [Spironucleus salmonicida]|eukprot:EST45101.1 Hypothetical protein SS50377_15121 [Spironucleus salmonicida]
MAFQRKNINSRNLHMKITPLQLNPKIEPRQNRTPQQPLESYLEFAPNIPTSNTRTEDDSQLKKRVIALELQTREQREINQNMNDFLNQQQQIITQLVSEMNLLTKRFHTLDSEIVNLNTRMQQCEGSNDAVSYKDAFNRQIQAIQSQMSVVGAKLDILQNEAKSGKNTTVSRDEWQWGQNVLVEQIKNVETAIKNFQFSTKK